MSHFLYWMGFSRAGRPDRRRTGGRPRPLLVEPLEQRQLLAALPYGAMPDDTGEFMLGDVSVTVVLMESNETLSAVNDNSETWTPASIAAVKDTVLEGLQWWQTTLADITDKHSLYFQLDFTYADKPVPTSYEPIANSSIAFSSWIYDFLIPAGFNKTGDFNSDIRDFNDAQRAKHGTHWAFTIFVVNDEHDADRKFAPGGFDRAFAFAGGRFFVTPAGRPASTTAHETGHMFWALDEYAGGGTYTSSRGYYNTQNTNAADNPAFRDPQSGQIQQPSIMASGNNPGDLLYQAYYVTHTSSQSSLEMIGWRDSDGDGVFDVLDVPHTLTGSGYYDPAQEVYRFVGQSSVQTLANRNPSGLQNDITINTIDQAQYRLDGGNWQTAAEYGGYQAALDFSVPVPNGTRTVEIRTVDDDTGVNSSIFLGSLTGSRWQNPKNRLDVNADGYLTPIDALQVINDLNRLGARALADADGSPPPYLDVSGDGSVSPGDVLLVVNAINQGDQGNAEGPDGHAASEFAFAADGEQQQKADGEGGSHLPAVARADRDHTAMYFEQRSVSGILLEWPACHEQSSLSTAMDDVLRRSSRDRHSPHSDAGLARLGSRQSAPLPPTCDQGEADGMNAFSARVRQAAQRDRLFARLEDLRLEAPHAEQPLEWEPT